MPGKDMGKPSLLIFMFSLINNQDILRDYVNSRSYNLISWVTVAVMIALTLLMVGTSSSRPDKIPFSVFRFRFRYLA